MGIRLGDKMLGKNSKNPISEVIFELGIENNYTTEENIKALKEEIKDKFPYNTIVHEAKILNTVGNKDGEIKTAAQVKSCQFHSTEDINNSPVVIEVGFDYCFINLRCDLEEYESYSKFKEECINLLIKCAPVFDIKEVRKIGLRYVNKIQRFKGNAKVWKNVVSDELLFDDLLGKYDRPLRMMGEFIFEENDFIVTIHYGMFNYEFPNPIAVGEFIMDIDCVSIYDDIHIYAIPDVVDEMHGIILDFFEKNVAGI